MRELHVPKIAVEISVLLFGASDFVMGRIFLGQFSAVHAGPETVSEILNGENVFVPLVFADGTAIVSLDQVIAVREALSEMPATIRTSRVSTVSGHQFTLEHVEILRPGHDRTTDFLNRTDRFLRYKEGDSVFHLNRRSIIKVIDQ